MLNNSLYSSDKMDWGTPTKLFQELNHEFVFTLDAAASDQNTKCKHYFTESSDGLNQDWGNHNSIFLNPPYGRAIPKWVEKAYNESLKPNTTIVCLIPVRSDTKWWHNFVMKSSEIRLMNRRLTFEGANNKAPFPACIVVFSGLHNGSLPKLGVQHV